ncbi:glycosyltransferase [Dyella ginsengisoli]|uniref:Glycosyltransferase n=1 Tax=Dyella ginsengisoli TaxID=363848 RepID=A0ABW8JTV3_9GAMM
MTPASNSDVSHDSYEISDRIALVKEPVVSVLILAYNHGPYLAQAIDSALAQRTDLPIELLIGEDCSTDNTRDIALRYQEAHPDIIRVFTADKNVGPTLNHRRILLSARGEFCAYLDGDDYWLPGKLLRQVNFLREHSGCAAVFTNALTVDQNNQSVGVFNDVGNEQFDLGSLLRRGNFLNNSSVVYRAASRPALLGIEVASIDYRWHLQLARTGFVAQLSEPKVAYRIGSVGSMVVHGNDRVRQLYWEAIMSVPREMVTDNDLAHGIADFIRRVFYRSLRTRQIRLLKEWVPPALAASPYGRTRTSLLAAGSVMRIAYKELSSRLRKGVHGHHSKVLYRR